MWGRVIQMDPVAGGMTFNPRRAAARRRTRRAGGGRLNTPRLTRLMGHAATRGKRHSKERHKSWRNHPRSLFRSGQRSGQQRSPKVKFGLFQHFSTNWRITRELEELQSCAKAHSITLLTFFLQYVLRFHLRSTFWPPGSKNSKNSRFLINVSL